MIGRFDVLTSGRPNFVENALTDARTFRTSYGMTIAIAWPSPRLLYDASVRLPKPYCVRIWVGVRPVGVPKNASGLALLVSVGALTVGLMTFLLLAEASVVSPSPV